MEFQEFMISSQSYFERGDNFVGGNKKETGTAPQGDARFHKIRVFYYFMEKLSI